MNPRRSTWTLTIGSAGLFFALALAGCSAPELEPDPEGNVVWPDRLAGLAIAEHLLTPVNATVDGGGHPGWLVGLPVLRDGVIHVSGTDAVTIGVDAKNCLLVTQVVETTGSNPDRPTHRFHCEDRGNMVFGEGIFGEPMAFTFIEDRGKATGSAYTLTVDPNGDVVELPLKGSMQAWTRPALAGSATIEYATFDFEGTLKWSYYRDIPVGRPSELGQ